MMRLHRRDVPCCGQTLRALLTSPAGGLVHEVDLGSSLFLLEMAHSRHFSRLRLGPR